MPPYQESPTGVLFEDEKLDKEPTLIKGKGSHFTAEERKYEFLWSLIVFIGSMHLAALYGLYLAIFSCAWRTVLFALLLIVISGLGVTAGAHRLWTHRSYKAKLPLQILLIILNTLSFENDVITWVMDHRVHHKYSETDADPHNATRGFFFSHVGWILIKKHPKYFEKVDTIDFSDIHNDRLLQFQRKYFFPIAAVIAFAIPATIPVYFWNENLKYSFFVACIFRIVLVHNCTWLVNSAAHLYGPKPYDKNIGPVENHFVTALAIGEGFHNYHHVYPWDYKAAELGNYSWNITTAFLDMMAKIGWAYDLKSVTKEVVQKRVERTGDGSHALWGWGDKDQPEYEIQLINKQN